MKPDEIVVMTEFDNYKYATVNTCGCCGAHFQYETPSMGATSINHVCSACGVKTTYFFIDLVRYY